MTQVDAYAGGPQQGVIPAAPPEPVDTTDAGDWFAGPLAVAREAGLAEAMRSATTAPADTVGWPGAGPTVSQRIAPQEVNR
jgi:ribokinase